MEQSVDKGKNTENRVKFLRPKPAHHCCKCAKCSIENTHRWRHNINSAEDYQSFLKTNYNIEPFDCLCNSCYFALDKAYNDGPTPHKKPKKDKCHMCESASTHFAYISDLNKFINLMGTDDAHLTECKVSDINNESIKIGICDHHYEKWHTLIKFKDHNYRCAVPSCGVLLSSKSRGFSIPNFNSLQQHFHQNGEPWFKSLTNESKICNKCRRSFQKIETTCDSDSPTNEGDKLSDDIPVLSLSFLISEFQDSISEQISFDSTDIETRALTETFFISGDQIIFGYASLPL
ncbi:unnamed protein product [Mytilus edulis]|uniref:Uncharacterized protein n=1 Tax=Mytilus edulis TaxID=6550 RepID=A0A8S3T062_MYTED|nr:unnamed protein product [Mytilus edulis]